MNQESRVTPALSQFVEKLAALRQTLNPDEQNLLDDMVANTDFDVQAHIRIRPRAEMDVAAHGRIMPAPRGRTFSFRFNPKAGYEVAAETEEGDDVSAHGRFITP